MKRNLFFCMCLIAVFLFTPAAAYADIGPKPSVVIDFQGLEGERYYATLLSEIPSTGPYSALGEHSDQPRYAEDDPEYSVYSKFLSYEDPDGYYFLQFFNDCTQTAQFAWTYYPPPVFKILLYFPEQDSFLVSQGPYERYAFDSYFTADLSTLSEDGIPAGTDQTVDMAVQKSYNWLQEILSLLARILGTIAIELVIALLFGFIAKKQLLVILATNAATQTVLNILLNIANYKFGGMAFVLNYLWMEIVVFAIEAAVYSMMLGKYSRKGTVKRWVVILYAGIANLVSLGLGLYIARLLPGVF